MVDTVPQDTIETVPIVDAGEDEIAGSEFDFGMFADDREELGSVPEVESQDTMGPKDVPSPFHETELQREMRLLEEFEEQERAAERAAVQELLDGIRLHHEETERLRARREQKERAEERRRQRDEEVEAVPSIEVESQDTIEQEPSPEPSANGMRDLPCEDSVNDRTGRLRYGLPRATVNPVSCEQCTARQVLCKGHPGRGCFFCIAVWRVSCSLATHGRAKRKRGDEAESNARTKRPKKTQRSTARGTEERRSPPPQQQRQQQQRQQQQQQRHQQQPQQQQQQRYQQQPRAAASGRSGRASGVPRTATAEEPGPSRFPGSFEDSRDALSEHESEDEADRALEHLARDIRQLRRWGSSVVDFADELAAQLSALRTGLCSREASGKGKEKGKERK